MTTNKTTMTNEQIAEYLRFLGKSHTMTIGSGGAVATPVIRKNGKK